MFLLSMFAFVTLLPTSTNADYKVECTKKPGAILKSDDILATICKDVPHTHGANSTTVQSQTTSPMGGATQCPNDLCRYLSITQGCQCRCGVVTCPNDAIVKPRVPAVPQ